MNILLLGGTGSMGIPLCRMLRECGHKVVVTSRSEHSENGVCFIRGNALDVNFLTQLMKNHYDVVVDFMVRSENGTRTAMDIILPSCDQYIFLSSSRVFAPINNIGEEFITENSPRLLDVCNDKQYVESNEYAIEKAREENLFFESKYKNWTIVRPTLTYNTYRLQFAYGEKEDWLFRVLHDQSVIIPKDMENVKTAMVCGCDVAKAILGLIGNKKALGEAVNVVSEEYMTWGEIFEVYKAILEKRLGRRIKVVYVKSSLNLSKSLGNYYQVKYARGINRCFSNKKLKFLIGDISFIPMKDGLEKCVSDFLNDVRFQTIDWKRQACYDKISSELTALKNIPTKKAVLSYLCYRYMPGWLLRKLYGLKQLLKN